jgi:type IV pilus assembly protein PilA
MGFTLIEIMVVIAIIGIVVAIAMPKFMYYQAKAKQSEAKANLGGIYTAEIVYFGENNTFSSSFGAIKFQVDGSSVQNYQYRLDASNTLGTLAAACTVPAAAGATTTAFTALAIANIDSDPFCDVWTIDNRKTLVNGIGITIYDDVIGG